MSPWPIRMTVTGKKFQLGRGKEAGSLENMGGNTQSHGDKYNISSRAKEQNYCKVEPFISRAVSKVTKIRICFSFRCILNRIFVIFYWCVSMFERDRGREREGLNMGMYCHRAHVEAREELLEVCPLLPSWALKTELGQQAGIATTFMYLAIVLTQIADSRCLHIKILSSIIHKNQEVGKA